MAGSQAFPVEVVLQQRWQYDKLPAQWAKEMLKHRSAVLAKTKSQCQDWFVSLAAKSPLYCAHFYRCTLETCTGNVPDELDRLRSKPAKLKELQVAIRKEGVTLMSMTYQVLLEVHYDSMHEWRSLNSTFSFSVTGLNGDIKVALGTTHCESMQAAIVDYIHGLSDVRPLLCTKMFILLHPYLSAQCQMLISLHLKKSQ